MTADHDLEMRSRERAWPYLRRHLAGELSLSRSLWVNGLLLPLLLALGLGAVDAWLRLQGSGLRLGSLALLLGWPLLLTLLAWGLLGVWRTTRQSERPARAAPLQAIGAPLLMAAVLLVALLHVGLNIAPRVLELASLVLGPDPLGTALAEVSADGRRLRIRGPLVRGVADRVRTLAASAPELRLLSIESTNGRLDEALQLAELVRARGLPTRASGECSVVCPFVFLAGSKRQLLPGARLGFHRISVGRWNPPYQGLANRVLRQRLAAAGLTPHLVTKALATPPTTMWYPEADELTSAGLVSVPERPLDVDLPAPQGATLADYTEALSASPLWLALDRRFQGSLAEAAARMHAASGQGAEAVQVAGHEVMAARLPLVLAGASAETRWLFTDILQAQIDALRPAGAALCRNLLLGDAIAHRRLPLALAWREAEWLLAALGEVPRATPPRRPSSLEQEVIRRTLGPRAPVHLANLWRPPAGAAAREPDCERATALLSDLRSIPAPERRLALRLMYERE